eukprot:10582721-Ditylum_brightwellii.AAC.1
MGLERWVNLAVLEMAKRFEKGNQRQEKGLCYKRKPPCIFQGPTSTERGTSMSQSYGKIEEDPQLM